MRNADIKKGLISATCGIGMVLACGLGQRACAVFDYSPHSSLGEDNIQLALMNATSESDNPYVGDSKLFLETLQKRRTELGSLIAASQSSGTLNANQADKFRAELDGLSGLENSVKNTDTPNFEYMVQLAEAYDSINSRLKGLMNSLAMQPLVKESSVVLKENKTVYLDDLIKERADLEARISGNLSAGRLTGKDGTRLRSMLDRVAVKEDGFRKSSGKLNASQRMQISNDLKKISSNLNASIL